jgi:hypothetical protein
LFAWSKLMRTPILLAAATSLILATPAFTHERTVGQNSPQLVSADTSGSIADTDVSSAKKKKKKAVTSRSSWGG